MQYKFKSRPSISAEQRAYTLHLGDRDLLLHILERLEEMSKQLDTIKQDVTANTTVTGSAVALLTSLKSELDAAIAAQANGDDGAALAALSTSLESNTSALAAAVAANTPAAPVVPPAPVPVPDPSAPQTTP